MDQTNIEELANLITNSSSTVFFGGAGVSTESGVPDFRGAHGIYKQNLRGEEILTPYFMHQHPEEFYQFNRDFFWLDDVKPNACHKVLASLEKAGKLKAVITQNIDDLHAQAGSKNILALHGRADRHYCEDCGKTYTAEEVKALPLVPRCQACGGLIRPDIVLYGESLDNQVIQASLEAISQADLVIIGGTSLTVYPAAGFIQFQKPAGKKVLINMTPTPSDGLADLIIRDPIGEVFAALADLLDLAY